MEKYLGKSGEGFRGSETTSPEPINCLFWQDTDQGKVIVLQVGASSVLEYAR
jgi:hypothetical protein